MECTDLLQPWRLSFGISPTWCNPQLPSHRKKAARAREPGHPAARYIAWKKYKMSRSRASDTSWRHMTRDSEMFDPLQGVCWRSSCSLCQGSLWNDLWNGMLLWLPNILQVDCKVVRVWAITNFVVSRHTLPHLDEQLFHEPLHPGSCPRVQTALMRGGIQVGWRRGLYMAVQELGLLSVRSQQLKQKSWSSTKALMPFPLSPVLSRGKSESESFQRFQGARFRKAWLTSVRGVLMSTLWRNDSGWQWKRTYCDTVSVNLMPVRSLSNQKKTISREFRGIQPPIQAHPAATNHNLAEKLTG